MVVLSKRTKLLCHIGHHLGRSLFRIVDIYENPFFMVAFPSRGLCYFQRLGNGLSMDMLVSQLVNQMGCIENWWIQFGPTSHPICHWVNSGGFCHRRAVEFDQHHHPKTDVQFLALDFNSKKNRVWGIRLIGLNKIQHPKKTSVDCSLNFAYHTRVTQTCGSSETSFRLL